MRENLVWLCELVTIPGLHDGEEWTRFEAQRRALAKQVGNSAPVKEIGSNVTGI